MTLDALYSDNQENYMSGEANTPYKHMIHNLLFVNVQKMFLTPTHPVEVIQLLY